MAATEFRFVSDTLADDVFTVIGFNGTEGISTLYRYEIELKAPAATVVDLDDMLDSTARLVAVSDDGSELPVNGMLASFDEKHTAQDYTYYTAVLVPRIWKLSVYRTNEIYTTEKTVDHIVSTVLEAAGFASGYDFDIRGLTGTFLERDYVCQFRESDMDFLSRLMENEGIYYYFQQKPDSETLIIANGAHYYPLPDPDAIFDAGVQFESRDKAVSSWICRKQRLPKKVSIRDYNPEQPSLDVVGRYDIDQRGSGTEYLYGDNFADEEEAGYLAEIRAEEFTCRKTRFYGESSIPGFTPGFTFNLESHPRDHYNDSKYLLLEVNHEASGLDTTTVGERGKGPRYGNSFVAIRADQQYRPPLVTPKPRFYGTMTAFVHAEAATGMAEVDDHGRYRVHLPFDRADGSKDSTDPNRKASAWIRMAQPYVGEAEGMYFPLRGGTEVLLTFINGDPDRPIISGAVPNASTPSLLTSEKPTESTIRTAGNNKIRMEDAQGSERIVMQSPTGGTWIRVGAPNDPITLSGDNPVVVAPGGTFTDSGAILVNYTLTTFGRPDPATTTTATIYGVPSDPALTSDGATPPTLTAPATAGIYRLDYSGVSNGITETASRTVVVLESVTDDTSAFTQFADGIRLQTSNNIWTEARSRYGDYRVGLPAPTNPPPAELQYLVDKVAKFTDFAPTGVKPYKYATAVGQGHNAGWSNSWTNQEKWARAVMNARVTVAKGDSINTQEGNIYDFGGYWNYNLGNAYVEEHVGQGVKLNKNHSLNWPAGDFGGDWGQVAVGYATALVVAAPAIIAMGAAIGAAPEASPFVITGLGLGLSFIGTGIWSSTASGVYAFDGNVGDVIWGPSGTEDTTANGQWDNAEIITWAQRVKSSYSDPTDGNSSQEFTSANMHAAMNKATTWVQKNIGDSYNFVKGNDISITIGHQESHARGDTYDFIYGGIHEETKYNGDGIKTSWEKSGKGIKQEMHFDPQNGALVSYEFKNRNYVNFDFSAELPSAPKFIVSVSIAPMTFKVDVSVGVNMTIKANIALEMIMDFSKTATFSLTPFKALHFKVEGSDIETNMPGLKAHFAATMAEQKAVELANTLSAIQSNATAINNGGPDIQNAATVIKNSGLTILN